ncbi:hypothetical protein FOCG_18466 [Fusarium oxysporum f. sp. radicis-lycopersici 26381]|nr:hypothetical protein FOCG_18466 [Fusarium oxysporum f. sp. radicis-lycopersici 26381]
MCGRYSRGETRLTGCVADGDGGFSFPRHDR